MTHHQPQRNQKALFEMSLAMKKAKEMNQLIDKSEECLEECLFHLKESAKSVNKDFECYKKLSKDTISKYENLLIQINEIKAIMDKDDLSFSRLNRQ